MVWLDEWKDKLMWELYVMKMSNYFKGNHTQVNPLFSQADFKGHLITHLKKKYCNTHWKNTRENEMGRNGNMVKIRKLINCGCILV